MPGIDSEFNYDAHLQYQEWLDDIAKNPPVDQQEECVNESVECCTNQHAGCLRPSCQCVCHISVGKYHA